uniref:Uncharacterized protein n=1 Tax=Candidatus Kentrum sp. TC TaxID=2126339 RepID=A0A450Z7A7_9GAMM|nr:MAG: hypothetical protein BECKTC1821D_GA0114238_10827 [Candidatus Kentron sp. TC]VFK57702.1 MAG: hypothetical protein BECKTC1821F_GA0114240_101938 [Candidatus Kentron sp. TC]
MTRNAHHNQRIKTPRFNVGLPNLAIGVRKSGVKVPIFIIKVRNCSVEVPILVVSGRHSRACWTRERSSKPIGKTCLLQNPVHGMARTDFAIDRETHVTDRAVPDFMISFPLSLKATIRLTEQLLHSEGA